MNHNQLGSNRKRDIQNNHGFNSSASTKKTTENSWRSSSNSKKPRANSEDNSDFMEAPPKRTKRYPVQKSDNKVINNVVSKPGTILFPSPLNDDDNHFQSDRNGSNKKRTGVSVVASTIAHYQERSCRSSPPPAPLLTAPGSRSPKHQSHSHRSHGVGLNSYNSNDISAQPFNLSPKRRIEKTRSLPQTTQQRSDSPNSNKILSLSRQRATLSFGSNNKKHQIQPDPVDDDNYGVPDLFILTGTRGDLQSSRYSDRNNDRYSISGTENDGSARHSDGNKEKLPEDLFDMYEDNSNNEGKHQPQTHRSDSFHKMIPSRKNQSPRRPPFSPSTSRYAEMYGPSNQRHMQDSANASVKSNSNNDHSPSKPLASIFVKNYHQPRSSTFINPKSQKLLGGDSVLSLPKKQQPSPDTNNKNRTGNSGETSNGDQQRLQRTRNNRDRLRLRKKKDHTITDRDNEQASSIKTKDTLHLPGKQTMKKMELLAALPSEPMTESPSSPSNADQDLVECPYCRSILDLNQSNAVALAYDEIKHKEMQFQDEQQLTTNDLFAMWNQGDCESSSNYKKRQTRRSVSNMEQFAFCRLHNVELVIKPEGDERNWPSVITFEKLLDRILGFKDELDLVIARKLDSSYRKSALEAYQDLGIHKARSTIGMMNRFETVLPGYYGTKGAAIIQEHLANIYLHRGKLARDVVAPQTAMEYLQQVLIPEVGFRLIREDLMNGDSSKQYDSDIDDQAKLIMAESAAYGSSLHPMDWNDAMSADESDDGTNDGNDDQDMVVLGDDYYGNGGGGDDHASGNKKDSGLGYQDRKPDVDSETQYILDDTTDDSEGNDDKLFYQTRPHVHVKQSKVYDLCDD